MARHFQVFSTTYERKYHYRFTCEHCGKTSDWKTESIKGTYKLERPSSRIALTENQVDDIHTRARESLDKSYSEAQEAAGRGDYKGIGGIASSCNKEANGPNQAYLYFNDSCPFCNEIQSWGFVAFGKAILSGWPLLGFLVGLLVSCINHYVPMKNNGIQMSADEFFKTLPLIPIVVATVIGFVVSRIHYARKRDFFKNKPKNRPEIRWDHGYTPVQAPALPFSRKKTDSNVKSAPLAGNAAVSDTEDIAIAQEKKRNTALFLAIFPWTGLLGIDRIYLGYIFSGILKFITAGGFLVLYIVDIVRIAKGTMRDKHGNPLV